MKKGFLKAKFHFAFLLTVFIVYIVLVYCRVGSLENRMIDDRFLVFVYCRVGSLERYRSNQLTSQPVYCRVGSLEICEKLGITTKKFTAV